MGESKAAVKKRGKKQFPHFFLLSKPHTLTPELKIVTAVTVRITAFVDGFLDNNLIKS